MKISNTRLRRFFSLTFLLLVCLTLFTACGLITPIETTDPHTHEYGDWENAKVPTCTEEGADIRICSCGQTEIRPVAAIGHTEVVDPAVQPTCTEAGLSEGSHCSACDAIITAQELVVPIEHTVVIDQAIKSTCTEAGLSAGAHCSVCGTVLVAQEATLATGHSHLAAVTAPTCTEKGYTTYTCTCGDSYVDDYKDAKGHAFGEWQTLKDSSCSETGEQTRECACGEAERKEIARKEHVIVIDHALEPTCTEAGLSAGAHCSACDEVFIAQETIPAKGHRYSISITAPTCTENGYTTYTCACGDTYVDSYTAATGHVTVIDHATLPSCTKEGYTAGAHCSICETVLVAQVEIEETGHTVIIDPGIQPTCTRSGLSIGCHCRVCGTVLVAQEPLPANGHSYSVSVTAPTCTEKGYTTYTCVCGDTYVDDYTAPEHANDDRNSLCDLCGNVLAGLYDANGRMLASWNELKTVYGMDATKNYSLETYATDTSSPHYILTRSPAFEAIGQVKIILEDTEAVGDLAFYGCESLVSVDIRNVTSIGDLAFSGCNNLESIRVEDSNPKYYSENNCLVEKATSKLVLGCKSSIIPQGVRAIGDAAFYSSGITSMIVPESVSAIGNHAFYACDGLEAIYYAGTIEEWTAITANAAEPTPASATVYFYSETLPTANGNYWHYADGIPEKYAPLGEKKYSFGALSDVHFAYGSVAEKNFERALAYLAEKETVDFTCIAGDLTGIGTIEEYERYKQLIDRLSPSFPVYEVTGNHDVEHFTGTTELVKPYFGEELYYSFTVGDDVYIMFGLQGWKTGAETFSAESLQWLYETLEENRDKRCFVFQHCPRFDGSGVPYREPAITAEMLTSTSGKAFTNLMEHYKNVIWFHGHTHMNLRYEEVSSYFLYDRMFGCHSVHIPSLASGRTMNDAGTGFVNVYTESEGYVIDVYDGHIVLRGYNFADTAVSPILSFTIDTSLETIEANTFIDSTGTIKP